MARRLRSSADTTTVTTGAPDFGDGAGNSGQGDPSAAGVAGSQSEYGPAPDAQAAQTTEEAAVADPTTQAEPGSAPQEAAETGSDDASVKAAAEQAGKDAEAKAQDEYRSQAYVRPADDTIGGESFAYGP